MASQTLLVVPVETQADRWELPDEEFVPESHDHELITRYLLAVFESWSAREKRGALIARNLPLRWDAKHPRVGVDPDILIAEPHPPKGWRGTGLCTWRAGESAPRVCIEVVSDNTADKDYGEGPRKYAASGARELWVFDPEMYGSPRDGGPHRLRVFRRVSPNKFKCVYQGEGPAFSRELGVWLVVINNGKFLVLSEDVRGERRWPTDRESLAERLDLSESARSEAEAARSLAEDALDRAERGKQRAEEEKRRAEEEKRRAEEEKRRAEEEKQRAEEEKRRAEAEKQRAEEEKRRAEEEKQRAERARNEEADARKREQARAEAAERELAALRARLGAAAPPTKKPARRSR